MGNVENIELTGTAATSAKGGNGDNTLTGNAAANTLTGGAGDDALCFIAPLGPDNVDRITDFEPLGDVILLDDAVMAGLGATGSLRDRQFWSSLDGLAHDGSDRIVHDTDGGIIWYDVDGSGSGSAIRLATVALNLAIGSADFGII